MDLQGVVFPRGLKGLTLVSYRDIVLFFRDGVCMLWQRGKYERGVRWSRVLLLCARELLTQ